MQVRTYIKQNGLEANTVIDALKHEYQSDWLTTSKLNQEHIHYLNRMFGLDAHQKQLPPNTAYDQTSNIVHETKEPIQQPTTNTVFDESNELCVSRVHKILTADLALQQKHIDQLLNDDYVETVSKINGHNQRKEDLLMVNLRHSYDTVKNHKPTITHQYTSEFDSMVDELSELGINIKS
ncbi:hypothetical protein [Scytonema sp. NUACC26]|uniref:hypothetical protein n=1 Tax=Scytonema sp. NUACC26 TaxID=3140176 RepID=UPI0034DBA354